MEFAVFEETPAISVVKNLTIGLQSAELLCDRDEFDDIDDVVVVVVGCNKCDKVILLRLLACGNIVSGVGGICEDLPRR